LTFLIRLLWAQPPGERVFDPHTSPLTLSVTGLSITDQGPNGLICSFPRSVSNFGALFSWVFGFFVHHSFERWFPLSRLFLSGGTACSFDVTFRDVVSRGTSLLFYDSPRVKRPPTTTTLFLSLFVCESLLLFARFPASPFPQDHLALSPTM